MCNKKETPVKKAKEKVKPHWTDKYKAFPFAECDFDYVINK